MDNPIVTIDYPSTNGAGSTGDLLSWCMEFINRSKSWRLNSFEEQWRLFQRNADSIFDPQIAKKKEPWQSKAFFPMTASHRESIQSQLFRTTVGPRPPLEVKSRFTLPDDMDQSENIRDLELRELEKARWEVHYNKMLEDVTTYGSGFMRITYEVVSDDRKVKEPVYEQMSLLDPASIQRRMAGQPMVIGYKDVIKEQMIYRGIKTEHLSIWDVFPDPKALDVNGNPIAYRYELTYDEILKGVQKGYYLPQAAQVLRNKQTTEVTPRDKKQVEGDRRISDEAPRRPEYGHKHECYELYARLPKKWVLINGEEIDDPEKLIACRVQFNESVVLSVVPSNTHDGEAPIYKCDYMPVANRFYGRGPVEMLKDFQSIINEEINQRLDVKAITINPMFAVITKAVVDPKDLVSRTGGIIKLNANAFDGQPFSVDHVFKRIEMGSVDKAAFLEPQELERMAQERTSVTKITQGLGSNDAGEAGKTYRGLELLRSQSGEKFAYIGLLQEFGFLYDIYRAVYMRIYENLTPQDVQDALGPERAQTFIMIPPEELERTYQYIPQGVYTMENKAARLQRLTDVRAQYAGAPFMNDVAFFTKELQSIDEDPSIFMRPEAEQMAIQGLAQQMADQKIAEFFAQVKAAQAEDKMADQIAKDKNKREETAKAAKK